jgi:4-hydroxy-2-oxoheptanedioate aldolase
VRNRAEAEEIVANAQYAPDGVRAMSNLVRAFRFSMVDSQFTTTNWEEYWRVANEQVVVMVIIEDREGMENLDDIASVPGVDVIWVGIGDLSQDMGIGGQYDHPSILEAQRAGVEAAKRHGKLVFDTLGQSPEASLDDRVEEVASKLSSGYNLMAWLDVVTYGIAISGLVRTARMGSERRDVQ